MIRVLYKVLGVLQYYPSEEDYVPIPAGETWTVKDTSRGLCLVSSIIRVSLLIIKPEYTNLFFLDCDSYGSSGTHYSEFYIIMTGDDSCAVQSGAESGITITTNF